jgi:hypothetical protein
MYAQLLHEYKRHYACLCFAFSTCWQHISWLRKRHGACCFMTQGIGFKHWYRLMSTLAETVPSSLCSFLIEMWGDFSTRGGQAHEAAAYGHGGHCGTIFLHIHWSVLAIFVNDDSDLYFTRINVAFAFFHVRTYLYHSIGLNSYVIEQGNLIL